MNKLSTTRLLSATLIGRTLARANRVVEVNLDPLQLDFIHALLAHFTTVPYGFPDGLPEHFNTHSSYPATDAQLITSIQAQTARTISGRELGRLKHKFVSWPDLASRADYELLIHQRTGYRTLVWTDTEKGVERGFPSYYRFSRTFIQLINHHIMRIGAKRPESPCDAP